MTGSVRIDVFPCSTVGVGQFIWSDANNGSIFDVEVFESFVKDATLDGDDIGESVTAPE